jgi:hypothetical protein
LEKADFLQAELLNRLATLRQTVRRRLVFYGLSAVAAGGVAAFLTIVAIDWLLWLPAPLRIVIGLLFLGGFVGAVLHWIVRPLRARLGVDEMAGKLEQHFSHLQDRLTSTVDFLQRFDAGSPAMMQHVIDDTDQLLKDVPFESTLSGKPLAYSVLGCFGAFLLLMGLAWVAPDWPRTGLYRYLYPLGAVEWPRDVEIAPITVGDVVPFGESYTVRMRVTRGLTEELRGVVRVEEADGQQSALAMRRSADGTFESTIDSVTGDLTYWFEAGDDSTVAAPYTLRAVRRPEVMEAVVSVHAPAYAGDRPPRQQDLRDGPIAAPLASEVVVDVQFSKPLSTNQPAGLRFEDGDLLPGTLLGEDRRRLRTSLIVEGDARFSIFAVDDDGMSNRTGELHTLRLQPDAPPVVTIVEPRSLVELTPSGVLRLVARVEDDYGVTALDLMTRRGDAPEERSAMLTDNLIEAEAIAGQPVSATAEHEWSLARLGLSPGDAVQYQLIARDNFTLDGAGGQQGASAVMRIKVISEVEFDIRIRDDLAMLETRIRQAALDQRDLLDQVTGLVSDEVPPEPLSGQEREKAATAAAQQVRLTRRVAELAERFEAITRRMADNNAGDEETRRQTASATDALRALAGGAMTTAGVQLDDAVDQLVADTQQQRLKDGAAAQQQAIDGLQQLVRTMTQWGDYQGVVTRTRDILDRQRAVRNKTSEIGQTAVGKTMEELSPQEAAELTRAGRQQEQLAEEVEQLLARMKQLASRLAEKDPAGAASVEAAVRSATAGDVVKKQQSAAEAMGQNRTAAATASQKAAEQAIRDMIDALKERDRRELAILKKKVEEARAKVARLLAEQEDLRASTDEAGRLAAAQEAFDELQQEQRRLQRNTRDIGDELGDVENAAGAGRIVRQAAEPMGAAEGSLVERQAQLATVSQDEAVGLLKDALAELEQLEESTDEEILRRTLAEIREELTVVLDAQREINDELGVLKVDVDARGSVTRAEARRATGLARSQMENHDRVEAMKPELEKAPVYDWALKRVQGWMQSSRDALDSRRIDDELVVTTGRVVREIERLIDALKATESTPLNEEFAEAESGGSGAGAGGDQPPGKPIPTIAELLVLRAMQADINERTTGLDKVIDPRDATEAQLRELRMLGEDQAEVRRLADLVTQQAQRGAP